MRTRRGKMSTLVDELLQDFEDSGSENGDERNDDFLGAGDAPAVPHANGDMDLDGDGGEEDDEMAGTDSSKQVPEDPEEAKARIEKLQLKDVNDVRNVAGLMKTLEPVLEVSEPPSGPPTSTFQDIVKCLHLYPWTLALTLCARPCRKSHSSKRNHRRRGTRASVTSRITRNTTS